MHLIIIIAIGVLFRHQVGEPTRTRRESAQCARPPGDRPLSASDL